MFVCYLQAAHVSVLLGDNSRTLQMFSDSPMVDVSSHSQIPAACLATDLTPAPGGEYGILHHSHGFSVTTWPKIL